MHRLFLALWLLAVCGPAAAHETLTPEQWEARAGGASLLIDVRTPQEFATGHLAHAVNLPLDQLAAHLAELPRDKPLVLYCRSGRRAKAALQLLEQHGFTQLYEIEGSILRWQQEGRPLVSP